MLAALIVATGGGFSSSGGSAPATASPAAAQPTATSGSQIQGEVAVSAHHLQGDVWQFVYTVRNTGSEPIAGLQINAPRSNLYRVVRRPEWTDFGSGVCGGKYPGLLIYWSTGTTSTTTIAPHHAARFGFLVNTSGTMPVSYSLSWDSARPQFGTTTGPKASSLRASGACG
jgi:hypothetical protein